MMNENIQYYSQIYQDRIVLKLLNHKRNGTFLDIGCHDSLHISNTATMELHLGWRGIAVDNDCSFANGWAINRPKTKFLCTDATKIDWNVLLQENQMPNEIDFLSIDLEPPEVTWEALIMIPFDKYRFGVIAFEHDHYRNSWIRNESRKHFMDRGYVLAADVNSAIHSPSDPTHADPFMWTENQDDIWIHSSIAEGMKLPLDRV
jgi:hypothetical protein